MDARSNTERTMAVAAVSCLDDPSRRALYDLISRSDHPLSKTEAASALGLARSTAAFHLDRLADEGLVAVEYKRLSGKTGPGSGRPTKLYGRSANEVAVSLPQRHYGLAADLLARAIEVSTEDHRPVADVLREIASTAGRESGASAVSFEQALDENDFEPRTDDEGGIVFGNCPFHQLAAHHPSIVCELNYEFVSGIAHSSSEGSHRVRRDPGAGRCCIRIAPDTTA